MYHNHPIIFLVYIWLLIGAIASSILFPAIVKSLDKDGNELSPHGIFLYFLVGIILGPITFLGFIKDKESTRTTDNNKEDGEN